MAHPIHFSLRSRPARWIAASCLAAILLAVPGPLGISLRAESSGKSAGREQAQLVWPAPPEQPRIAYVQSIVKPSDAGVKASGFRRLANWLSGSQQGAEPLSRPFCIAFDDAGNLCATDTGVHPAVCFYDIAAKRWYRWEQIGETFFSAPVSIAKKGGVLFVADSAFSSIVAFGLDGKLQFRISDGVVRPTGLAISGDRLLVADAGSHCIAVFDLRGKFLSRFGSRGTGPGEFNYPTHITADSRGNIYVTDSVNDRIQVFDSKFVFQRQIGAPGDGPGSFSRPKGVGVDSEGRTYVADAMFDNFQIFDSASRLLLSIGHHGAGPGEFSMPNGVAVARDGRIYVADSFNGRIQVFKPVDVK